MCIHIFKRKKLIKRVKSSAQNPERESIREEFTIYPYAFSIAEMQNQYLFSICNHQSANDNYLASQFN